MGKLIECPMCDKEISPNALACPNCGEPIRAGNNSREKWLDDIKPIISAKGFVLINGDYQEASLYICQTYSLITNSNRTELYVKLSYDSLKDLDSICKRGGFFKDVSVITFFNKRTGDEMPDFKIPDKAELNRFRNDQFNLIRDVLRNPYKYMNIICPSCGSNNVHKITDLSKAGNVLIFGVFAIGSLDKTFECNNCSYKW